ncbi:hypothetical protein ARMGADRAFT_822309 [Armillaria gallica]|uniref:Uncharacterized protein n=1 Tax=Armillaria gallica TaxID=47427 RepID=A0A2H3CFW8_ARMGA|nr:hypothetical protein ARMGADRAFT_822309 [Armillaria gallica]
MFPIDGAWRGARETTYRHLASRHDRRDGRSNFGSRRRILILRGRCGRRYSWRGVVSCTHSSILYSKRRPQARKPALNMSLGVLDTLWSEVSLA